MRHRQRRGLWPNIWYGAGLIVAIAVLVGVQVVPKLEQYSLRRGGTPVAGPEYGGAKWRLIDLAADGPENGTRKVTAIIGTTPATERGSRRIREGCEVSVRDARDRVWTARPTLGGGDGDVPESCNPDDGDSEPITVPVGTELKWQASFEVAADAAAPLRVEIRLRRSQDSFLRLAP